MQTGDGFHLLVWSQQPGAEHAQIIVDFRRDSEKKFSLNPLPVPAQEVQTARGAADSTL